MVHFVERALEKRRRSNLWSRRGALAASGFAGRQVERPRGGLNAGLSSVGRPRAKLLAHDFVMLTERRNRAEPQPFAFS